MVEQDPIDPGIDPYSQARKEVEKARVVRSFVFHLIAFILGNGFLGFWNAMTYFVKGNSTLWFFLPLLFWGVGLILHYVLSVVLFDEWWELDERTIGGRMRG